MSTAPAQDDGSREAALAVSELPLPESVLLVGACAGPAGVVLAVGGNLEPGPGVVVRRAVGGPFVLSKLPDTGRLYDVCLADATTGFAVGLRGCVQRTTDGGESWQAVASPGPAWLAGVEFADARSGVVAGTIQREDQARPFLARTTDGGEHWSEIALETAPAVRGGLRALSRLPSGRLLAVGEAGQVWSSGPDAMAWQRRETGTDRWLRAISACGPVVLVGGMGVLLRSEDDGVTWSRLPWPDGDKLNGLLALDARRLLLSTMSGVLESSEDGGRSFARLRQDRGAWTAMVRDGDRVLVFGDGDRVLTVGPHEAR